MDYIGFSNYAFKREQGVQDPIIPFFFIPPDKSVAEVLADLAIGTQTAMYFDEYNNFVTVMKEVLLPEEATPVFTFRGDVSEDGKLPNIVQVSSKDKVAMNSGTIDYTQRYIQRNYGSVKQAMFNDAAKTWIYAPTLLWEVAGDEATRATNEAIQDQSNYALTAMPLNSDLNDSVPEVKDGVVINNIFDVGESVYFIARYKGYLYANSEIIKYDAVEFAITGLAETVWISNTQEYQDYLLKLPFSGKIYPTGRVRIYSEPKYYVDTDGTTKIREGEVAKHGRGQFGTPIVYHDSGINPQWTAPENVYGVKQESNYLFTTAQTISYPATLAQNTAGGITAEATENAKLSTRNGLIKNTLAQVYWSEEDNEWKTVQAGTIQSSALVFTGTNFASTSNPIDYVAYIKKAMDRPYVHYGTRMRVIGEVQSQYSSSQSPVGGSDYFIINPTNSEDRINIAGGSGGLGIMVNPATNNGYFMELVALSNNNTEQYNYIDEKTIVSFNIAQENATVVGGQAFLTTSYDHEFEIGETVVVSGFNINEMNGEFVVVGVSGRTIVYNVTGVTNATPDTGGTLEIYIPEGINIHNVLFYKVVGGTDGKAYPVKLWSGLAKIVVDTGEFAGQYRLAAEETSTVYDIAIEYKDTATGRMFFLYINDRQIATVLDPQPLNKYDNIALFVRGSSKVMFENVYALVKNYTETGTDIVGEDIPIIFGAPEVNASDSLKKYAMSGLIQSSYLSRISSGTYPEYLLYYDEFGTIMRECAHFNIKYDRAFPALYSQLAPTLNQVKTYSVSGFHGGAYGADFLVFNCVDKVISLDATSGNFLRILGIAFTQSTTRSLTVDDYFNNVADLSNPVIDDGQLVYSPTYNKALYDKLKISRMKNGIKEFNIASTYVQNADTAESVMQWMIKHTLDPKRTVGLNTFSIPTLQLGDIVNIDYQTNDGTYAVATPETNFVVYNIEYGKGAGESNMNVYLMEI
jgi:hypothetical protein